MRHYNTLGFNKKPRNVSAHWVVKRSSRMDIKLDSKAYSETKEPCKGLDLLGPGESIIKKLKVLMSLTLFERLQTSVSLKM